MTKQNKIYALSDEEFIKLVKSSTSYRQISTAAGYSAQGRYSYDLIKRRISELGLSTDHFRRVGNGSSPKYSLEEILVENSSYLNLTRLKKRLLDADLLEYKCQICGNTGIWQGEELTLQLDHINGCHTDNRLENLRFLCPNCHSQTETFSTRLSRAKSK